ncbi:P-type DNA transfer ATPase VirB11 [Klebsiella oxytoca]|uniref:P-type DNA transfer ATPase VirB11 n=1 Tax=Klebsiella oxytoca TaxID=571 RepID=UPI00254FBB35|nr:P-type DNA transfer ATPase VirB11 [Klebsiella oxytoca]MEC5509927.1 P-type DNA transfer ATPase VirB11 [Klebsiella oxytoca]
MKQDLTVNTLLRNSGIQDVMDIDGVTEIAVNQCGRIFYEGPQGWQYRDEPRAEINTLGKLANTLAVYSQLSYPLGDKNPLCSVILPGGQRGQIAVAPATEHGHVSLTIRKPSLTRFSLASYAGSGRLSEFIQARKHQHDLTDQQKHLVTLFNQRHMEEFFTLAVQQRLNILLVGGTGSGKTTFMKALADLYPTDRRIFTIEDVHELTLPNHLNHLHLFYKSGGVTPKQLIESCMRMKPDHVFLAELRGDEALHYFEMLNTGHAGSLTTTHANDCQSAFWRLADLVKQSPVGQHLDYDFILKLVRRSIDVVCFMRHGHLIECWFDPELKASLQE